MECSVNTKFYFIDNDNYYGSGKTDDIYYGVDSDENDDYGGKEDVNSLSPGRSA